MKNGISVSALTLSSKCCTWLRKHMINATRTHTNTHTNTRTHTLERRTTDDTNSCHTSLPDCPEGLQEWNDAVPTPHQQRQDHRRLPKGTRMSYLSAPTLIRFACLSGHQQQECWSWTFAWWEMCDFCLLPAHSAQVLQPVCPPETYGVLFCTWNASLPPQSRFSLPVGWLKYTVFAYFLCKICPKPQFTKRFFFHSALKWSLKKWIRQNLQKFFVALRYILLLCLSLCIKMLRLGGKNISLDV